MFVSAKPSTRMLPISKQNVLFQLLTMGMSLVILSLGMPTKMDHSISASFSSFPTRRKNRIQNLFLSMQVIKEPGQHLLNWKHLLFPVQSSHQNISYLIFHLTSSILSSERHLFLLPGAEKSSWKYAISYEPDTIYQSVISYRPVEQTKFEGGKKIQEEHVS